MSVDLPTKPPLLEAAHLRKSYGAHIAVHDVSLALQPGEVLGLLGPNGAGKSTTMMMLAGLLNPDAGTIHLCGELFDPRLRWMKSTLGVVPQDLAIYPELTAMENVHFFGRLYGFSGRDLMHRCARSLERVGLSDTGKQESGTFSGGMKRRLNFAIALVHGPAVLILDEPTVGVDPQSRAHLLDCVRQLSAEGVAVIYASHYMEEVQTVCQRVAIIDHGRMLAYDSIAKLLAGLAPDLYVYVDDASRLNGQLDQYGATAKAAEGEPCVVISGKTRDVRGTLAGVLDELQRAAVNVTRIETQQTNLERYFLELTGRTLRD